MFKKIILLLIITTTFNITLHSISLPNNDIELYSDSKVLYNFIELSLSFYDENETSVDAEILGFASSIYKNKLLVGLSCFQISFNSDFFKFTALEFNGRLNCFDFVSNDNNFQLYDFINIKLRPLSIKYLNDTGISYDPQILLGYEITIRHDITSFFIDTDYVINPLDVNQNHFLFKTGIRMALFGPFIPV